MLFRIEIRVMKKVAHLHRLHWRRADGLHVGNKRCCHCSAPWRFYMNATRLQLAILVYKEITIFLSIKRTKEFIRHLGLENQETPGNWRQQIRWSLGEAVRNDSLDVPFSGSWSKRGTFEMAIAQTHKAASLSFSEGKYLGVSVAVLVYLRLPFEALFTRWQRFRIELKTVLHK